MSYANRHRPPRTLTEAECKRLLAASGKRAEDFRDHVLFAIALGTGLRISEISALNCGDVYNSDGHARTRIMLRVFKGSSKELPKGKRAPPSPTPQEVMIGDQLRAKLDRYRKWKNARAQWLESDSPLFSLAAGRPRRLTRPTSTDYLVADVGVRGGYAVAGVRRMSKRRITERWHHWRKRAKLPALGFHCLRHTFCQRLYEHTRDVRLVQRAARHANLTTTTIYASASAEDVLQAVQGVEL